MAARVAHTRIAASAIAVRLPDGPPPTHLTVGLEDWSMLASRSRRAAALAALASMSLLLGIVGPAAADTPAFEMDLPAGLACAGFELQVDGYGDGAQVSRERPGHGGAVLTLTAGTGYALTFSNGSTGASIALKSNGSATWTATYADGSQTLGLMGHNVVILFPADGGPSTTLYAGRVVIDVASDGVWTVRSAAGESMDICAAIS